MVELVDNTSFYGDNQQFNSGLAGGGLWDRYKAFSAQFGAGTAMSAVSGVLAAIGSISGMFSANKMYKLYEQQERMYIANAEKQAERARLKGDIALRNMRIKHLTEQGQDELAVAAAGAGGYSGSFLDKLVQNKKYAIMDERTQSLENVWEIENIKRNGYISAISTAGQAMATANQNKQNAWNSLSSFAKEFVSGVTKDMQAKAHTDLLRDMIRMNAQHEQDMLYWKYTANDAAGQIVQRDDTAYNMDSFNAYSEEPDWSKNSDNSLKLDWIQLMPTPDGGASLLNF